MIMCSWAEFKSSQHIERLDQEEGKKQREEKAFYYKGAYGKREREKLLDLALKREKMTFPMTPPFTYQKPTSP